MTSLLNPRFRRPRRGAALAPTGGLAAAARRWRWPAAAQSAPPRSPARPGERGRPGRRPARPRSQGSAGLWLSGRPCGSPAGPGARRRRRGRRQPRRRPRPPAARCAAATGSPLRCAAPGDRGQRRRPRPGPGPHPGPGPRWRCNPGRHRPRHTGGRNPVHQVVGGTVAVEARQRRQPPPHTGGLRAMLELAGHPKVRMHPSRSEHSQARRSPAYARRVRAARRLISHAAASNSSRWRDQVIQRGLAELGPHQGIYSCPSRICRTSPRLRSVRQSEHARPRAGPHCAPPHCAAAARRACGPGP
jgi:hypothetical protein